MTLNLPNPPDTYDKAWMNQYTRALELEDRAIWARIQSLGDGLVSSVNSLTEMKGLTAPVPDLIYMTGYYSKGDGGGGFFYWSEGDTTTPIDAIIVEPTNATSGRYRRIFPAGYYDARWFGILADNSTDETVTMQAIATYAMTVLQTGAFSLQLPAGTIRVSDTISFVASTQTVHGPLTINGAGWSKTTIDGRMGAAFSGAILKIRGVPVSGPSTQASYIAGGSMSNLRITGANANAAATVIGVDLMGWTWFRWDEIHIDNTSSHCIYSHADTVYDSNPDQSAASNGTITGCLFERSKTGYIWYNPDNEGSQQMVLRNSVLSFGYSGCLLLNSTQWRIIQTSFVNGGWYIEAGTANPSGAYGLEIHSDRPIVEQCEFGPNLTAHIGLGRCREGRFLNNRWIQEDTFNTGFINPLYCVAFSVGGTGSENNACHFEGNHVRNSPLSYTTDPNMVIFKKLTAGGTDVVDLVAIQNGLETDSTYTVTIQDGFTTGDAAYKANNKIIFANPNYDDPTVSPPSVFVPPVFIQGYSNPYIFAYVTAATAINTAAIAPVPLTNAGAPNSAAGAPWYASFDFAGPTNHKFTAPMSGKYRFTANVGINNFVAADVYHLQILLNGVSQRDWFPVGPATAPGYFFQTFDVTLSAGDTIEWADTIAAGGARTYIYFDAVFEMLYGY